MEKQLYFDTAATTPMDLSVAEIINKINIENFGNPSSVHAIGQKSHNIIERSRLSIANILRCKPSEIIFTSGGSEANNMILKGVLKKGDHFITTAYEHPSVLELAKQMKNDGINVTFIKPNENGLINIEDIESRIQNNTKLISIMWVNNELGTINDIKKIGEIADKHNILFHSDAVQFIGKKNVDLSDIKINFLSLGAHKFYGPKGIGVLYCKSGSTFIPLIDGGGQENGLRAGTENISLIAGMDTALQIASDNYQINHDQVQLLENQLIDLLKKSDIKYRINGKNRLTGILNITFFNVEGQSLLMNLDMEGIAISYGSACSSGSTNAPQALIEMGMQVDEARCSVRISIGKMITENNIHQLFTSIENIINRIKKNER